MSRTSMPARAISVLLAFVLTCTLIPTTSIAFASTADEGTPATQQDATDADGAADEQSEAAQGEQAQPAPAATERVNELVPVASQKGEGDPADQSASAEAAAPAEQPAAQEPAPSDDEVDILTASVQLGAASTVVTSNGLTYAVNADGASVILTGWTGNAPAGTLNIPSQITVGSTTYAVANIGSTQNLGGGARHF